MAQHFVLAARARSISPKAVLTFSDDQAHQFFAEVRWSDKTQQTCPHCGVIRVHRYVPLQKRWKCRDCYKAFSVTSSTVFHGHKLPLQTILSGIVQFANAVKGLSALQMSRDLDVQCKTALVLLHEIRESLWKLKDRSPFEGRVEIDSAYVLTYVRPKNRKVDRVDRRLEENQNCFRWLQIRSTQIRRHASL